MPNPSNESIAAKFREMADLLEAQHEDGYRVAAYRRAANMLLELEGPIDEIVSDECLEGVMELPGIGRGIGTAIVEMVTTGRWAQLDRSAVAAKLDLDFCRKGRIGVGNRRPARWLAGH